MKSLALIGLLLSFFASAVSANPPIRYNDVFRSAVAVWHMTDLNDAAGTNPLKLVGSVTQGKQLTGKEQEQSLAAGSDGVVAQFNGGYLDAGQGTDGRLNLTGSALTVSVRLRNPSGQWDSPIFSKRGSHDRLVYNLFAQHSNIGFELGTRDNPDVTQVSVPASRIGTRAWHTIICRYNGTVLQMFADGVLVDEASVTGPLRTGNTEPVLIGAETDDGTVKTGWRGQIDYVALWNRGLSDSEITRLNGGANQVALNKKQYQKAPLLPARADLYQEKYRPQFHFTARQWTVHLLNPGQREEGWLNDPNGLIFLDGTYHLFAQRWNKCWIHALSKDLIHWTEVQPAFWEDHRFGGGVQSGGAVYDKNNTSGLSHDHQHPPLVAFWAGGDNHSQCISYSLDKGRTWTKYAKNPILDYPERDPKVFWYAPVKKWIMALSGGGSYHFFSSTNLLHWTKLPSDVPDSYECPDLFQLPLDGDFKHMKWVLVRGNGEYSVGEFDGAKFIPETDQLPGDQGPNFYATQSWGDIAGAPGRRVQIAWMRGGDYPNMPFNQQMSFPCDLTLHMTASGPRVFRKPIPEICKIEGKPHTWKSRELKGGGVLPLNIPGDLFHIVAHVRMSAGSVLTFHVHGMAVTLTDHSVACNTQPVSVTQDVHKVEILVDRTSVETFVNDGEVSLSTCFLPSDQRLSVEDADSSATLETLQVYPLKSIWKTSHKR